MSSYTGTTFQQMRQARAKLNAYRSFDIEEDMEFCPLASPLTTTYDSAFLSRILSTINTQQTQLHSQVASYDFDNKKMNQSRKSYMMQQQARKQPTQNQYSQYADQQQVSKLNSLNYGLNSSTLPSGITGTLDNGSKSYQNQQLKYPKGGFLSPSTQHVSDFASTNMPGSSAW